MKKWLLRIVLTVIACLLVFNVYMYWLMTRPPEQFTQGMSKLPTFAMYLAPFPPMWAKARAGTLAPGDAAPDFELETTDRSAKVRLSANRGIRPVVLIFGSYT